VRQARGNSRAGLAAAIGVHGSTVAYWEKGRSAPSPRSMEALLRFYGLTAGQFYSIKIPRKGGR